MARRTAKLKTPFANVLPILSTKEYEALREDLKNGQREAAIIDHEGNILDGHHRYKILRAKLRTEILPGAERMNLAERKAYAVRSNLSRRQLSPAQTAALQREVLIPLANELRWGPDWQSRKGKPIRSEAEVGKLLARPQRTIARWTARNMSTSRAASAHNPDEPRVDSKIPKTEYPKIATRAETGETQEQIAADYKVDQSRISQVMKIETKRQAAEKERKAALRKAAGLKIPAPAITEASWEDWLPQQEACDLLLTDPPYMTDVEDIDHFAESWLPEGLAKVKPSGRAYVFIGAYPDELFAYLSILPPDHLILEQVLVWTYRNTIGPAAQDRYNLNWQAVLYYRGVESPPLDCPSLNEQFAVQDLAAPDGRTNGRLHAWQKPDELAQRFIRHATRPGELVLDPFAGTGTFLLAAFELRRRALGCDSDPKMIRLAVKRGCAHAKRL